MLDKLWLIIPLAVALILILFWLSVSLLSYKRAFYSPQKRKTLPLKDIPGAEKIAQYKDEIKSMAQEIDNGEFEEIYITSFDGKRLYGRLFKADSDIYDVIFHGYKSTSGRDCAGGYRIGKRRNINVLAIDQRAHGKSDGVTVSFGVKERFDCLSWSEYLTNRFGKDIKIILSGISMGASTVLMASSLDLPQTVKGIIADCGYSSPTKIIARVCEEQMHLNFKYAKPFIDTAAGLFGNFKLDDASPDREVRKAKVPILLIHGSADEFVPCSMCDEIEQNCASPVKKLIFEDAGHGMSYFVDTERYVKNVEDFIFETCCEDAQK